MRIGHPVQVKLHPSKDYEPEKYIIQGEYLVDYIVKKEGSKPRAINKDLVKSWNSNSANQVF